MEQNERRLWLIKELLRESGEYRGIMIPKDEDGRRQLLRGLMNVRMPGPISRGFVEVQDRYLQEELKRKGITDVRQLEPLQDKIYLWRGDITTLRCDAIVNAANRGMTGCYHPNHRCIDNCIHTFSGVQLRNACAGIMERQGHAEGTGHAKITEAYNLPCRYVRHPVGPIVHGRLMDRDRELLADCYRSCLELAAEKGLESVAFCCISTGEFHFPNDTAAEIAVRTVKEFMAANRNSPEVIFNVFKEKDYDIYRQMLG